MARLQMAFPLEGSLNLLCDNTKKTIADKIPFSFITTSLNANCTIVLSYQEFFEERQTERLGWDREQQDAIIDRITKSAQATT
jgi:hypothetical protein